MAQNLTMQTIPNFGDRQITPLWSQVGSGEASVVSEIVKSGVLWIAVGTVGGVSTSIDGTYWSARSDGFDPNEIAACSAFGNGLWLVAGSGNAMYTSTDGAKWRKRASPFASNEKITSVCFSGSLWFAGTSSGRVASSEDGFTWGHVRSAFPGSQPVRAIAASGDGTTVAVGDRGSAVMLFETSSSAEMRLFGFVDLTDVTYSAGVWVVSSAKKIYLSKNLVTWAPQSDFFRGKETIKKVIHNTSMWFVVSGSGKVAVSRDDCETWNTMNGIRFKNGPRIAVGPLTAPSDGTIIVYPPSLLLEDAQSYLFLENGDSFALE